MSKYKVGDKVVVEIEKVFSNNTGSGYCVVLGHMYSEISIGGKSEPLSTYTEPLERKNENKQKQIEKLVDKLHRQAAEITRLLAENKELKEDFEKSKRVNLNMGRVAGQNEAWELARKIKLIFQNSGTRIGEVNKIFGDYFFADIFERYTYSEAAAKVAEWERAKEEIKVGDVYRSEVGNYFTIRTTDGEKGVAKILFMSNGEVTPDYIKSHCTKTGRHIDIDGFLKRIGGEEK